MQITTGTRATRVLPKVRAQMIDTREPGIADAVIRLRRWNAYRYEDLGIPSSNILHRLHTEGTAALVRATGGSSGQDPWDVQQVTKALYARLDHLAPAILLFVDAPFSHRAQCMGCTTRTYKKRTLEMLRYIRDFLDGYDGT